MIKFFSGRIGTARLLFFVGLVLVVAALVVGLVSSPHKGVVSAASFFWAIGFTQMIIGAILISMIDEGGSPHDFH